MKFKKILNTTLNEMAAEDLSFKVLSLLRKGKIKEAAEAYKGPPRGILSTVKNAKDKGNYGITDEVWNSFLEEVKSKNRTIPDESEDDQGEGDQNKKLSATAKEEWFADFTNLTLDRGEGKIYVQSNYGTDALSSFLKREIEKNFYELEITKQANNQNQISLTADLSRKKDLILEDGGKITLEGIDPSLIKSTKKSYPANSLFEMKSIVPRSLEGHYIFQAARISTYGQIMDILEKQGFDQLVINNELYGIDEIRNHVTSKEDTKEKKLFRDGLKELLQDNEMKRKLLSKVVNYLNNNGEVGIEFFEQVVSYLNTNKQQVVNIPENLFVMAVGGKKFETGNNIIKNFDSLNDVIYPLTHENIFFSVERGRIAFDHVEANFTFGESFDYNSLAKEIINIAEVATATDTETPTEIATRAGEEQWDERIKFNIEVKAKIFLNYIIK